MIAEAKALGAELPLTERTLAVFDEACQGRLGRARWLDAALLLAEADEILSAPVGVKNFAGRLIRINFARAAIGNVSPSQGEILSCANSCWRLPFLD